MDFALCALAGIALGFGGALAWVVGTKLGSRLWAWLFRD